MTPPEAHTRLLLALVRGDWDEAERLHADSPVDAGFAETCRECDVHPQIHALLERRGRLDLAGAAAGPLGELRAKVRHDNMLLIARAEQALDALLGRGITPLALKGFDLIHRVYGFDERTLDDVDLLLPRESLREALAALSVPATISRSKRRARSALGSNCTGTWPSKRASAWTPPGSSSAASSSTWAGVRSCVATTTT